MASPSLADSLHAGRYLDVLLSEPAAALIDEFVRSLQQLGSGSSSGQQQNQHPLKGLPSSLPSRSKQSAQAPSSQGGPSSVTTKTDDHVAVSARERLTVGLAALNAFLQANVTGPVL